jgi:DNA-binding CsgD family transcriptional regulator
MTPLVSRGAPAQFLAVARVTNDARARCATAARRWELSARQAEVLAWVVDGASNARIAAELGIAEGTVEAHVTAIFARAEVASRAELIAVVLR